MKKIQTIIVLVIVTIFVSILFLPIAYSAQSNETIDLGAFQSAYVEYPRVGIRQNMTNATFKYEGKWRYKGIGGIWYDVSGDFDAVPGLAELLVKLKTANLHDGFSAILDSIKNDTTQGNIFTDQKSWDQEIIRANKDRYGVSENNTLVYYGGLTVSPTQTTTTSPGASPNASQTSSSSSSGIFGDSLPEYISNIYNWSIGVAAGLAVIMLIYAGYLYVTSAGNPESINLAKEIIIGAIAGFVFLILAALILRFVM